MGQQGISVKQILGLIPDDKLALLAQETEVNWQVKKLWGELMFKLLLMSILQSNRISLRVIAQIYQSPRFRLQNGLPENSTTTHTSLSDRLATINSDYFEAIFNSCYELLSEQYNEKETDKYYIRRYDSTLLSASAKLLKTGMSTGRKQKDKNPEIKHIKLTIGFTGLLSNKVKFYNEQKHLSEDEPLRQTILASSHSKDSIIVFDRGLKKRQTFVDFSNKDMLFVTRINPTKGYKVIKTNKVIQGEKTESLELISDEQVHLYHQGHIKLKFAFRLIKARSLTTDEVLFFLTNIQDMDAASVAQIYKCRWDIEVFFRFLKQEMNLKHMTSYSENGIRVMMYMTLIAAMLFMVYKKLNKLKGFKIPKMKFIEELDKELMKEVVTFCGGNPQLLNKLYPT
jgi:hypothetical protein